MTLAELREVADEKDIAYDLKLSREYLKVDSHFKRMFRKLPPHSKT